MILVGSKVFGDSVEDPASFVCRSRSNLWMVLFDYLSHVYCIHFEWKHNIPQSSSKKRREEQNEVILGLVGHYRRFFYATSM